MEVKLYPTIDRTDKGKGRAQNIDQSLEEASATASSSTAPPVSNSNDISESNAPADPQRPRSNTVSSLDFASTFSFADSPRQGSIDRFSLEKRRRYSAASTIATSLPHVQSTSPSSPISVQAGDRSHIKTSFITRQDWNQSFGSPNPHGYRSAAHARTQSSLGSSNVFDFFGPSSLASNSTAASSFHYGSPKDASHTGFFVNKDQVHSATENLTVQDPDPVATLQSTRADLANTVPSSVPDLEHDAHDASSFDSDPVQQQSADGSGQTVEPRADPPIYARELLPSYEEAPAYTPSSLAQEASGSQPRTRNLRAAAASRFLSSRLVKKLNLPPVLLSRVEGMQTPNENNLHHSHGSSQYESHPRTTHRSDSLPDLRPQHHSSGRLDMDSGPFVPQASQSTNYRYIARPRDQAWGRSRPATTVRMVPRSHLHNPPWRHTSSQPPTLSSSRRNSRESRRSSRTTATSIRDLREGDNSSNRSGAATPSQCSHTTKRTSLRHLGMRNIGDLFLPRSKNRDRDVISSASAPRADSVGLAHSVTDVAAAAATANSNMVVGGNILRETVSPVAEENLISARVPISSTQRPNLLHAAHSSPQAGITVAPTGPSVLVSSTPSYFEMLPRELVVACFRKLVDSHVHEHQKAIDQGTWRGRVTTETKWVALEAAVRELTRLSRVSRSWQSYTFDGQLWQSIDYSMFSQMPESVMLKIARSAGPFVRRLDLHGMSNLKSSVLTALFEAQCPRQPSPTILHLNSTINSFNQLQDLNLEGCRQVSSQALSEVLSKSANLRRCNMSGMTCVSNTTLCALAQTAPSLEVLNVSRCRNVDGEGIRSFLSIQAPRYDVLSIRKDRNCSSVFRELYASGVANVDCSTLESMGRYWPNLEVLDLSYCSGINDASITALVSSDEDVVMDSGHYVPLSPRQAGSQGDDEVMRRTFQSLKKLKLSSCRALTDRACVQLAHAVPNLEVLELANVGAGMKDSGLVKLLATVPHLKRLDLERATHITDAVLSALTPPDSHAEAYGRSVPEEGVLVSGERNRGSILGRSHRSINRRRHGNRFSTQEDHSPSYNQDAVAALIPATGTELTHLVLSSANKLTADAMLLLINRCPFLYHLDLDDTQANNAVATHFVRLAHYRRIQNAHISLIDCRSFSRDANLQLVHMDGVDGGVRPRSGERGYAYRHFNYDDAEPVLALPASTHDSSLSNLGPAAEGPAARSIRITGFDKCNDECNPYKPVLKSFWGWQSVDARIKQKRKMEQRASKRQSKSKMGNVVAIAFGLPGAGVGNNALVCSEEGSGGTPRSNLRWPRLLPSIGTAYPEDDDHDATNCSIM